jgi:hypothetical protein
LYETVYEIGNIIWINLNYITYKVYYACYTNPILAYFDFNSFKFQANLTGHTNLPKIQNKG